MYIRTKWLITSRYMKWRRPYRYLVKSVRHGQDVEQVYIRYVGPGISGGWEGRVPDNAHPDWMGETQLELEDAYGTFSKEERMKHGVEISRSRATVLRNFRKGPILSYGDSEVTVWADEDFWGKKSKIPLETLQDMSVELSFALNRLPPGMLKEVDDIYLTNLNDEAGTLAYYDQVGKNITVMAEQIRDDYRGVDFAIPHEVSHAYFHDRWGAAERKALKTKKWKSTAAKYFGEHKKPDNLKVSDPDTWGLHYKYELNELLFPQVLDHDKDLKAFFEASSQEGPLTEYSGNYWSKQHMGSAEEGSDGRIVQVHYQHYVNENLAEATHIWFASDSTYRPVEKAKKHPKTYKSFAKYMQKDAKGFAVPISTGKPPSAQDKTHADRVKARNDRYYYVNVAKFEDGFARRHAGHRKTTPRRLPHHPGKRKGVEPDETARLAALEYRKFIPVHEALDWRKKGIDVDPKGITREEMTEFRRTHGMRTTGTKVVPKSVVKAKQKATVKEHKAAAKAKPKEKEVKAGKMHRRMVLEVIGNEAMTEEDIVLHMKAHGATRAVTEAAISDLVKDGKLRRIEGALRDDGRYWLYVSGEHRARPKEVEKMPRWVPKTEGGKYVHLIEVGDVPGTPADQIEVGDHIMYNYGGTSEVVKVERKETKKASWVIIHTRGSDGKIYTSRMKPTTHKAVVVKDKPSKKAPEAKPPAPKPDNTRSIDEINYWEGRRETVYKGRDDKWKQDLATHKSTLANKREYGESQAEFLEREGLTEFFNHDFDKARKAKQDLAKATPKRVSNVDKPLMFGFLDSSKRHGKANTQEDAEAALKEMYGSALTAKERKEVAREWALEQKATKAKKPKAPKLRPATKLLRNASEGPEKDNPGIRGRIAKKEALAMDFERLSERHAKKEWDMAGIGTANTIKRIDASDLSKKDKESARKIVQNMEDKVPKYGKESFYIWKEREMGPKAEPKAPEEAPEPKKPSKKYTDLDGMQVGRWRCPECYRGVHGGDTCAIHGRVEPIDIKMSENAKNEAYDIRCRKYLEEHKGATDAELAKELGVSQKALKKHLAKKEISKDHTYRTEYRDLYGLKAKTTKTFPKRMSNIDKPLMFGFLDSSKRHGKADNQKDAEAALKEMYGSALTAKERKEVAKEWLQEQKAKKPKKPSPEKPRDMNAPPMVWRDGGKTYNLIMTDSPENANAQAKTLKAKGHDIKLIDTRDGKVAIYGVRPKTDTTSSKEKPERPKAKAATRKKTPWEEAGMTYKEYRSKVLAEEREAKAKAKVKPKADNPKDTMFFESKSDKYSAIISLKSPAEAKASTNELDREFKSAGTNDKRTRIVKYATLAANRAEASSKRDDLSDKELKEFTQIAKVYRKFVDAHSKERHPELYKGTKAKNVREHDALDVYHEQQRKKAEAAKVKGISGKAANTVWLKRLAEHDDAQVRHIEDKENNPVPLMPRDPITGEERIATPEERKAAKAHRKTKDTKRSAPEGAVRIM